MGKQAEDTKTIDMIGEKARRGRPPTGNAKTGAQRMREMRARAMNGDFIDDIENTPLRVLTEALPRHCSAGNDAVVEVIFRELLRRTRGVNKF